MCNVFKKRAFVVILSVIFFFFLKFSWDAVRILVFQFRYPSDHIHRVQSFVIFVPKNKQKCVVVIS